MSLWSWDHFSSKLCSSSVLILFFIPHSPLIFLSIIIYVFKCVLLIMSAWVGSGTSALLVLHLAPAAPPMFFHWLALLTCWGEKSVLISLLQLPTWESASWWGIFLQGKFGVGRIFFLFRVTFVEMHCFLKIKSQVNARNKILLFISLAFKRDPQESLRKMIYRDLSSLNCLDDY